MCEPYLNFCYGSRNAEERFLVSFVIDPEIDEFNATKQRHLLQEE